MFTFLQRSLESATETRYRRRSVAPDTRSVDTVFVPAHSGNKDRADLSSSVPVIVLGGSQNALSVARSLSEHGVEVIAINYRYEAIRFSRCARYLRLSDDGSPKVWERFLLADESDCFRGSVLLPCSDEAIRIIVNNYGALSRKFFLDETDPETRRELLDKFVTYRRAEEAGIPTVPYSLVKTQDDLNEAVSMLRFPLIMKPLYSPDWRRLKFKAALVTNEDQLTRRFSVAAALGVSVVLMEYIPGADDRLCSYYTYLDEQGNPLVHFTKRIKRRFPLESGDGTYHVTDWIPEAAELGLRFFRHINYRGLGMIEFKWDERDKQLKVIEANARFSNSDCLIGRSGVNLALITYNRVLRRPQPAVFDFQKSLVLCRPLEDAFAAWSLWKAGKLQLSDWFLDLRRTDVLPFFQWNDPLPAFAALTRRVWRFGVQLSHLTSPG